MFERSAGQPLKQIRVEVEVWKVRVTGSSQGTINYERAHKILRIDSEFFLL